MSTIKQGLWTSRKERAEARVAVARKKRGASLTAHQNTLQKKWHAHMKVAWRPHEAPQEAGRDRRAVQTMLPHQKEQSALNAAWRRALDNAASIPFKVKQTE